MIEFETGRPLLALGDFDLAALGYVVEEFFLSGTAVSYRSSDPLGGDGDWTVEPADRSPFTTRLVVLRPADAARFNGAVAIEWLNVSAGTDGAPDWSLAHRELVRGGYAYVGVSAQKAGLDGNGAFGALPGVLPLRQADPDRYGRLSHPGDAFSYDIYSQAGWAIRGEGGAGGLLGPLVPKRLLALGESQSAAFLTTYHNAVAPIATPFDAFLIHSRFGSTAPLDGVYVSSSQAPTTPTAIRLRTDLTRPVITLITETDLMRPGAGFLAARQPDTDYLRTWEVAGTAHADTYVIRVSAIDSGSATAAELAEAYVPTANIMGIPLGKPMNSAPQHHYVVMAALSALDEWVKSGNAPARAQPLRLTASTPPQLAPDSNGNALGGIRSPWVDCPIAILSGLGQSGPIELVALFGVTEPFGQETLATLYPGGKPDYLGRFEASLRQAIDAGFILPADEAEIMALAAASYPVSGNA